jgi:hypothetical protein
MNGDGQEDHTGSQGQNTLLVRERTGVKSKNLNAIDQTILRILSHYDQMTLLELWYELGEDDTVKERLTDEELLESLESLVAREFIEKAKRPEARKNVKSHAYRVKAKDGL